MHGKGSKSSLSAERGQARGAIITAFLANDMQSS